MVAPKEAILFVVKENSVKPYIKRKMTCERGHDTSAIDSRYSDHSCKRCTSIRQKEYRQTEAGRRAAANKHYNERKKRLRSAIAKKQAIISKLEKELQ